MKRRPVARFSCRGAVHDPTPSTHVRGHAGPQSRAAHPAVVSAAGLPPHRVAIANSRLVGLDDGQASFTWKDYRQDGKTKVMTIAADEFIRRFLQHTVPDGFHRIRHVGFLANRHRTAKLTLCRDLLAAPPPPGPEPPRRWQDRLRDLTGHDVDVCPNCRGRMLPYGTMRPCPPPARPCGPCRNLRAKSADLESVLFQSCAPHVTGPSQDWGCDGQLGTFAFVLWPRVDAWLGC